MDKGYQFYKILGAVEALKITSGDVNRSAEQKQSAQEIVYLCFTNSFGFITYEETIIGCFIMQFLH